MKMQEIQELTKEDIELELSDAYEEFYNLRFQHAMHQLDNPLRLRDVRKDIARLKTVLREFELGIRQSKEQDKNSLDE
ncbi:MAG: 50S ribosomal protein L29 [bacterium]